MRKTIQGFLIIFFFSALMSCRFIPNEGLFQFQPKDREITASVQQTLKNYPDLAPFTFHIETADGIVYLSGYVKSIRQSDTAEALAARVSGVKSVENNIIVRK